MRRALLCVAVLPASAFVPMGCGDGASDACADVDCSLHGECVAHGSGAECRCDDGYEAQGLTCVDGGSDSDSDTDSDTGSESETPSETDDPPSLVASFETIVVRANCQPIVAPDPWTVSFDLNYDNTAGTDEVTANVTGVTLTLGDGVGSILALTIDPSTSGPVAPGASEIVSHAKTSSSPDIDDCSSCGEAAVLEVTLDVAGDEVVATSDPRPATCVY